MGRGSDEALRDLLGLQEKMCRLFDEQVSRIRGEKEPVSAHWSPSVDIYETEQSFVLVAEIAGVDQEAIQLEISDEVLVLRGDRPSSTPQLGHCYHRIERPHGSFQRLFRLPAVVDPEAVSASCKDGLLRIILPKKGSGPSRSISVHLEGG